MLGDQYTKEQARLYTRFIGFNLDNYPMTYAKPKPEDICPLCGDRWDCERGENLCHCQFVKRKPTSCDCAKSQGKPSELRLCPCGNWFCDYCGDHVISSERVDGSVCWAGCA